MQRAEGQWLRWIQSSSSRDCHRVPSPTGKYWITVQLGFEPPNTPCAIRADWSTCFWPVGKQAVAGRALSVLHVCAGTRAPSELIVCDSSQSPGHWSIITLWNWMRGGWKDVSILHAVMQKRKKKSTPRIATMVNVSQILCNGRRNAG